MARALVYQSTNQLVAADSIAAEAHEAASRALLLDPTHADAQLALGINPEQPVYALLAKVKLAAGDAALALELLQHQTDARAECWSGTNVFVLRRRTDADAELVALESRSARDADCSDIKNDPLLQNLRSDSRYTLLLRGMQRPE